MVAKVGDLKPVDEWEENIRKNAKYYTVIGFTPGKGNRHFQSFEDITWAKAYAIELMKDTSTRIRAAMVYAVNEYDNHALVGTCNADLKWKQVEPKRY